jgi:hypothetical protein
MKAGLGPGFFFAALQAGGLTRGCPDARMTYIGVFTMSAPHDLMLRSVLARLDYWTGEAVHAKRANDNERQALCRRSIDEYNVLIQNMIAGSGYVGCAGESL